MKLETSDSVLFHQDGLFSECFSVIEEMRRQGKFCDVRLKAEGHVFNAHRLVLSATIPYFHAMFTSEMLETQQQEIEILGIDALTLESVINFSYTSKITINVNTVRSLLTGACFFHLNNLKEACSDFLRKRLQMFNVLEIIKLADSLDCASLMEGCNKYIQVYFHEISLTHEFSELVWTDLLEFLSSDELLVSSEEQVFEALMRWIKKDPETRKEHLPLLLSKVRLPLLGPQYLTDNVAKEELIRSSHDCRDLLDEARDYHLMPERRLLLQSYKFKKRYCTIVSGLIFAIGGLSTSGDSLRTVELYDPLVNSWSQGEPMISLRSRVSVAVMDNCLYAIGGYSGSERLSTVEVFNPDKGNWSLMETAMHHRRSAAGAATLERKLYVCGGYNGITSLNTVECYDPETDSWTLLTSMVKNRSACSVVAFSGYLYALGGHDGLSIFDSVEQYDPSTGKWVEVAPMLSKRCRLGVTILNNKLYACGGYDGSKFLETVEVYDPITNVWQNVTPMNTKRSRVALVANMGKLWAIGGYDGVSNLSTVEVYDPRLDKWTFETPMSLHKGGVGVGVLPFQ